MSELSDKVKNTLDEGRILIIGTQVLLGFLFRSVFEAGFEKLSVLARYLELVGLALMLIALALLILPTAYHRIVERGEDTQRLHSFATVVLGIAILPFALGAGGVFFVAGETVFGHTFGVISGVTALAVALFFWYVLGTVLRPPRKKEQAMSDKQATKQGPTELSVRIEQVLTELRVVLPGAQALLGFQFTALLTETFEKLPQPLKTLHFISLSLIGLSIALLMTPASYHRIVERGAQTERFHRLATTFLLAALVPLALGIAGDFYLVAIRVTESTLISIVLTASTLVLFYGLWFGFTITSRYTLTNK